MSRNFSWGSISVLSLALGLGLTGCPAEDGEEDDDATVTTTMTTTMTSSATMTTTMGDSSGDSGDTMVPTDVDYMADIQPIWDANCTTACHEAGGAYETFDLTAAMSFAEMATKPAYSADMTFLTAGDAEGSFLVGALRGSPGVFVRRMPLLPGTGEMGEPIGLDGADPLPEEEIALIEAWINAGANP